ncbi:MAG: N-acetylmuramoyl-L-alanine amidase [Frankia sp.]
MPTPGAPTSRPPTPGAPRSGAPRSGAPRSGPVIHAPAGQAQIPPTHPTQPPAPAATSAPAPRFLGESQDDPSELFDEQLDHAVRAFQQSRGLSVDGIIGPNTIRAIDEARRRLGDRLLYHSVSHPFVGDDVGALQERLADMGFDVGRPDGIFGLRTEAAVRDFQRNRGLAPDGSCGPLTLRELKKLERTVVGGRSDVLRESTRLLTRGPSLLGVVVAIDPGHGGDETGAVVDNVCERDLIADLASRLEARLLASGLEAYQTHGAHESPDETERARRANEIGADLLVSLHVDSSPSSRAQGVATYYFGTARGTGSAVGERLAQLVQRELVARTDFVDCRTHAKTWELLRHTRMPAVRVDLGYLTNTHDAAALSSREFRAAVAEGMLAAIQRLFLPPDLDPPTGQLRVPVVSSR